jgi:hypothetical protein
MKKIRRDKPSEVTIHIYVQIPHGNSLCYYLYLKQTKMSSFYFYLFSFFSIKSENMRAEQVLPGGRAGTSGKGGCDREGG